MKHLKKFENFHSDGLEIDNSDVPKYNQAERLAAQNQVEAIFSAGAGKMVNVLCKEVGIKLPKTDEELEAAKEKAIQYFIDNPERIKEITPPTFKSYPYYSGDGIARVTNVGGTHHDKTIS
jgi:hypothetical protein